MASMEFLGSVTRLGENVTENSPNQATFSISSGHTVFRTLLPIFSLN